MERILRCTLALCACAYLTQGVLVRGDAVAEEYAREECTASDAPCSLEYASHNPKNADKSWLGMLIVVTFLLRSDIRCE